MKEDMCIEVNEKNEKIGLRLKSDFIDGKYIHRSVFLILFNSRNQILIHKRSPNKKWYPNLYLCSVAGTVDDLSVQETIKKETKEEIGLDVEAKELFTFSYFGENDRAFHTVFIAKSDENITPDPREIQKIEWIIPKALKKDIDENPQKYTPPFVKGMKIFFERYGDEWEGKK